MLVWYFHLLIMLSGNLQEQPAVRTSFVKLTGGVLKARPKSDRRGTAGPLPEGKAQFLESLLHRRIAGEIGVDPHIVPPACGVQEGFDDVSDIRAGDRSGGIYL